MKIFAVKSFESFSSKKKFKRMFKTCSYSDEKFENNDTSTIEHIVPLSQGGKSEYANYLVVKRSWNNKRSSKPLDEFVREYPQVKDNIIRAVEEQDGKIIDGVNWADEVKKTLKQVLGEDIFEK